MGKFEESLKKLEAAVKVGQEYLEKSVSLASATSSVCPPLEKTLKDLCEEHHKVESIEEDKIVIHYTSIAIVTSMLQEVCKNKKEQKEPKSEPTLGDKTSSLRLYDSVHLNDPTEGNYFTLKNLPQKYDWLGEKDVNHAYIASFINPPNSNQEKKMSDDLVFWRAYGQEGEGCSLSIPVLCSRLQKVIYGLAGVKRTIKDLRSILDLLDPLVKSNNSSVRKSMQEKLAETIWQSLERFRYLYKSLAYKHERECRFVLLESDIEDKNNICFEYQDRNNSPARIRHYYEHEDFHIEKLLDSRSSITLGPCVPYRSNVRNCIEALLERANLYGPRIKPSKISYRKS